MGRKKALPTVKVNYFYGNDGQRVPVGSAAWFEMLPTLRSFIYEEGELYLTVRCEKRRNGRYWYGYRRVEGKLKKVYLGNDTLLTYEKLKTSAAKLVGLAPQPKHPPAVAETIPPSEQDNQTLLFTKLRIPATPQRIVARQRLTIQLQSPAIHLPERMHQRRSKPYFTTLIAPSGYGKSTLLSEWVQTIPHQRVAWVSLEEEDNDLYQFWRYVVAALQLGLNDDHFGQNIVKLLHGLQLPPIRTILKLLLNEIQGYHDNIILIFDDYHFIQAEEINQAIGYFLAHCPARLHVVISSRIPLPLPLGRLRTQCHMTELRQSDLKLTEAEVQILLQKRGYARHPIAQQLLEKTDGWVTGLNLALLAMEQNPTNTIRILEMGHHYFTDYFFDNVWQQQPKEVAQFLLYTALLDTFSVPLAAEMTQYTRHQASHILAHLEESNLFLITLDQVHGWYRYHHLFSQALRRILTQAEPQIIPTLHRRAANWYLAIDHLSEGLHHLLLAEAWSEVAALLQENGLPLMQQGKLTQLIRWIQSLPETVLNEHTKLMSICARALMLTGDLMVLEAWLNYLEQSTTPNSPTHVEVEQIRTIVHGIEENPHVPEGNWWESLDALTVSINYWADGRVDDAVAASEQAIRAGQSIGNDAIVLLAASNIAFIYALTGELNRGLQFANQTLMRFGFDEKSMLAEKTQPNLAISPLLMTVGYALYERNELHESLRYFERAKALCEQLGRIDYLTAAHILTARTLGAIARPEDAHAMMVDGVALARESKITFWPLPDTLAYQAWVWLHYGEREKAVAWMAGLERADEGETAVSPTHAISHWVRAEILTMQQAYAQAIPIFEKLLALSDKGIRTEPGYKLWLGYAIALYGVGEREKALDILEQVLTQTEREGYVRHFLNWYRPCSILLHDLLTRRTVTPALARYAQTLLTTLQAHAVKLGDPLAPAQQANAPLIHLTARELDVLHYLEKGLTNREIAAQLVLSPNTVKSHLAHIYRKLEVSGRETAVARFRALQ